MKQTIPFGAKAKEKVTGLVGIVIGRASYITGCDQYLIQPPISDGGDWKDGKWFDEGRLVIVEEKAVEQGDLMAGDDGCDIPAPTK